jgi:hypothetical protein
MIIEFAMITALISAVIQTCNEQSNPTIVTRNQNGNVTSTVTMDRETGNFVSSVTQSRDRIVINTNYSNAIFK